MSAKPNETELKEWLKPVVDPEIGQSLVDLGLIYGFDLQDDGAVTVNMTLTSPGCPFGDTLVNQVKARVQEHEWVKTASINLVWEPRWNPATMASEECKEVLGIW